MALTKIPAALEVSFKESICTREFIFIEHKRHLVLIFMSVFRPISRKQKFTSPIFTSHDFLSVFFFLDGSTNTHLVHAIQYCIDWEVRNHSRAKLFHDTNKRKFPDSEAPECLSLKQYFADSCEYSSRLSSMHDDLFLTLKLLGYLQAIVRKILDLSVIEAVF